jgi:tetratricopeptide (TPR) repeat protein
MAQLNRTDAGVSVIHAVTEGVGKTQLAAAYARAKLAQGWRLVAWVNARNIGSLLAGLSTTADVMGLSDADSGGDTADLGRVLRHRLEADGDRCLVVFDDAADPNVLRPFVPVTGSARILITGNLKSAANLGTGLPVGVFSADEALTVLAERTGLADEAGAAAVAAELGYLPLALAQAAAVISGQHLGSEEYLKRLRALPVLDELIQTAQEPYPRRVVQAVQLSMDAVRADDPAGVCDGVREIMAVLSGAGVRRNLLYTAGQAGVLAKPRRRSRVSAAQVDRALTLLMERSLLTFSLDGQTLIAHRLVLQVEHDRLARQGRLAAVCRAAASVLDKRAGALARSQDRADIRDISEQVTALRENAAMSASGAKDELATVLLPLRLWALYRLNDLGDSASQAIAVGEPLVADFERVLGPDHPETLNSRNSLALAYLAADRAAEAIPLFKQALVDQERLLGPDHPHTLTSQNNLAAAYRDAGRSAEAILLFELTLAARERLLGPDHPDTLNSGSSLAAAYLAAGRAAEAILLLELILTAREWLLGPDHPTTINTRGNLAGAYWGAGRTAEAIPLLEQTLAAHEQLLGVDHPDTLGSRNKLANAYRDTGRATEAIPLVKKTLAARERSLGVDHPSTLASRNNLASAYRATGQASAAIPLFEQNLAACERLLGANHPRTLTTRNNLALARQEAGRAE